MLSDNIFEMLLNNLVLLIILCILYLYIFINESYQLLLSQGRGGRRCFVHI